MNFFSKPYTTLFSFTLVLGILIAITSNNWISIWIGLELNLYSFIPLILHSNSNQEKEASIKYFLTQALASIILLFASIPTINPNWTVIIIFRIIIKLGIAPCHFWFPSVINSITWPICWTLTTLQKIAPIFILTHAFLNLSPLLIFFISASSTITGRLGGLNQTQIRAIIAYSSIAHIGWITARAIISPFIAAIYFLCYIMIITALIQSLSKSTSQTSNVYLKTQPNTIKIITLINLFRLAGLPPIFGFFPKLLILLFLLSKNFILLPLILVFSSTINLYFYLKLAFNIFFSQQLILSAFNYNNTQIYSLALTTTFRVIATLLLFFL